MIEPVTPLAREAKVMDKALTAVAAAIRLLAAPTEQPPTPSALSMAAGLDAAALDRAFTQVTGADLKRFLALLPFTDGRALLDETRRTLDKASQPQGPVTITAITSRRSDPGLVIRWGRHQTPFGMVLAAATDAGLCRLGFDGDGKTPDRLRLDWPSARLIEEPGATRDAVALAFDPSPNPRAPLTLAMAGTAFQRAVWQALLAIPAGTVQSYQDIAAALGRPQSARAVGGAVGANPIAVLIPCHRVIAASGALHHYGWGPPLKRALIAWERSVKPSTSAMP